MGGGCACNYLKESLFLPNSNIPLENYQYKIEEIDINKEPDKANLIFSNLLDNPNEKNDINKRYSDCPNFEKKNFEKHLNMKNNGIKLITIDWKNTSCNETNNKRISSNFNSSNFFGSNIGPSNTSKKNDEIIEEEENNINKSIEEKMIINVNPVNENNKHNSIKRKIKKKEDGLKKAETNFNCNLGENNYIFINITKGSSLINSNEYEKIESITPKMMLENQNLDDIFKGKKKLFSHLCKKNLNNKSKKTNKSVFIHTFDMNKYNEEMLYIINKIRIEPESFIKDIDYLINNNIKKTEEGIFMISFDVDEKIKLMDNYMAIFENVKKVLKELADSQNKIGNLEKIKYNEELEITFDESPYEEDIKSEDEKSENDIKNIPLKLNDLYEGNRIDMGDGEDKNQVKYNENIKIIYFDNEDGKENKALKDLKIKKRKKKEKRKRNINNILDLNDDKIANLILQKRKEIKNDYPHNIFKLSVIKDIKINILVQIGLEEFYKSEYKDKNTLKEIIFDPKYKNFGVSWTNEINRNFVSIACFA